MHKTKTLEKKGANQNGIKRAVFVGLSLIFEAVLLIGLFLRLSSAFQWINVATRVIAFVLVLVIYAEHKTSSMKMPWIILILLFPIAGILLFLMTGLAGSTKRMTKRYEAVDEVLLPLLPKKQEAFEKLSDIRPSCKGVSSYIINKAKYPVYDNSDIEYFDDASKGLEAQLDAISKAEKFIFMEYFAIEDKIAWKQIEEALVESVRRGVEVRIFYDDIGSIGYINRNFAKRLQSEGIRVRIFNPVTWFFNLFLNNRDHRKFTVIDGRIAFTGGYNMADEYFNLTHPYGEWKDSGLKITGEAARSFTIMFLEMWNAVRKNDKDDTDFSAYLADYDYTPKEKTLIQPYADSPMDDEHVGEEVYISIINKSSEYCFFITPYLIITDEMAHAISLAAKRGVDVRIITPGIPDKKIVYSITRSFYNRLVRYGVKIYEWTPGFCHAKMCVCDDEIATCGTINLDYRSLYHHFENGCVIYDASAIAEIKADFIKSFGESRNVTELYLKERSGGLRLLQMFLRLFAELL